MGKHSKEKVRCAAAKGRPIAPVNNHSLTIHVVRCHIDTLKLQASLDVWKAVIAPWTGMTLMFKGLFSVRKNTSINYNQFVES